MNWKTEYNMNTSSVVTTNESFLTFNIVSMFIKLLKSLSKYVITLQAGHSSLPEFLLPQKTRETSLQEWMVPGTLERMVDWNPDTVATSCLTSCKEHKLLVPQFLHLQNTYNFDTFLMGILELTS